MVSRIGLVGTVEQGRNRLWWSSQASAASIFFKLSGPMFDATPGLHRAHHPLPARNERGEDPGEGKPIRTPPPLTHPMEEREKSRSLMQPWREWHDGRIPLDYCALSLTNRREASATLSAPEF